MNSVVMQKARPLNKIVVLPSRLAQAALAPRERYAPCCARAACGMPVQAVRARAQLNERKVVCGKRWCCVRGGVRARLRCRARQATFAIPAAAVMREVTASGSGEGKASEVYAPLLLWTLHR